MASRPRAVAQGFNYQIVSSELGAIRVTRAVSAARTSSNRHLVGAFGPIVQMHTGNLWCSVPPSDGFVQRYTVAHAHLGVGVPQPPAE